MKFARDFRDTLASQDFPVHWVEQAIPYGQLKKCLKKVQRELHDLGLDPETLKSLTDPENTSPVALNYRLNTTGDGHSVRPILTVDVHLKDGVVVDASLTSTSRKFLEKLAVEVDAGRRRVSNDDRYKDVSDEPHLPSQVTENHSAAEEVALEVGGHHETIEVPLVFDNEFFDILQSDVNNIDALQASERRNMTNEIQELRQEIGQVSQPSRFSKTDLARWRQIFELYLDAEVFFATNEQDHGARSSQAALKKLQWFQQEVETRQLARCFKLRASQQAFTRFVQLNSNLLKNLQFQELNQLAVLKILKKFDKRTSLGVSKRFRLAVQPHMLMTGSIGKDVCAQLSQDLVTVVPQLTDYLCPICFAVAYRPVRLDCQHIFCIRCVVHIQRRRERYCPLCRADVVMQASGCNLDNELGRYMRKYFAKEVKEKERSDDIERGMEEYGQTYNHKECIIM